jgi:hypothetical protein
MVMDRQETDVNIPSTVTAIVAEFGDRDKAESVVDALEAGGFSSDQVSFVARGAEHDGDKFIPGVLLITVHADGRNDQAIRILNEGGATKVTSGLVSATGEVLEESQVREEASSG